MVVHTGVTPQPNGPTEPQTKGQNIVAKIVFDEQYGNLSYAQRAAYRKNNVSPMDHDMLVDEFGAHNHTAITQAVKDRSTTGMYQAPFGF